MNEVIEPHARIILDLHTHHPAPQPEGIVCCSPEDLPAPGTFPHQFFSVGVHPWDVKGIDLSPAQLAALREAAARPDVLAIGETGFDTVHPGAAPMAGQVNAFRRHVEISEELGKPLVIHSVRGQQYVLDTRRDMGARQAWAIHGFRGKETVMRMYADAGIYLSFGAQFNPASLAAVPAELLLAETDEAPEHIQDVIAALNVQREEVTPDLIAENTRRFLGLAGRAII